jgi:hypothetical protein
MGDSYEGLIVPETRNRRVDQDHAATPHRGRRMPAQPMMASGLG